MNVVRFNALSSGGEWLGLKRLVCQMRMLPAQIGDDRTYYNNNNSSYINETGPARGRSSRRGIQHCANNNNIINFIFLP